MTRSVKDMVAEANAAVERIDPDRARALMQQGALVLDIRDTPELEKTGKVAGAHHVTRGMLEFRADPEAQYHDPEFRKDRPIVLYCGSGGRAALAGKTLKEMGYQQVYNLGGFKDWADAGGEVEDAPGSGG